MPTLRYSRCAGYSGRTDIHQMVATSFVLSALRSKAYRSVSGVATEENRFNVTPKVDFRLSQMRNNNAGGMAGKTSNATAEVVMNWNLYSGGADSARVE